MPVVVGIMSHRLEMGCVMKRHVMALVVRSSFLGLSGLLGLSFL